MTCKEKNNWSEKFQKIDIHEPVYNNQSNPKELGMQTDGGA